MIHKTIIYPQFLLQEIDPVNYLPDADILVGKKQQEFQMFWVIKQSYRKNTFSIVREARNTHGYLCNKIFHHGIVSLEDWEALEKEILIVTEDKVIHLDKETEEATKFSLKLDLLNKLREEDQFKPKNSFITEDGKHIIFHFQTSNPNQNQTFYKVFSYEKKVNKRAELTRILAPELLHGHIEKDFVVEDQNEFTGNYSRKMLRLFSGTVRVFEEEHSGEKFPLFPNFTLVDLEQFLFKLLSCEDVEELKQDPLYEYLQIEL